MNNQSILIVEDEMIASLYLKSILESLHFKIIYEAKSYNEALEIVQNNHVDLAFMDINIEGLKDGIECAILLNKVMFLPVIFTTAYGDTNTISEATTSNLYGYLIKPFEARDVEATLSIANKIIKDNSSLKVIKKEPKSDSNISIHKEYKFDFKSITLTYKNIPVGLTRKEAEVLSLFCSNINQNISYELLREYVWKNENISNSTIRDTVSRLKKKISEINIKNVINYGYILRSYLK